MANTRVVAITIPAAKVSATLADKDVLLVRANFPDEMFFGANAARSDGGDLRFYTDSVGTTEIARDIVAFEQDGSLGADDAVVQVWVKVPSLSSATDTTIYCQYGDGALTDYAATDTYGRNAVWANCHAAWHLTETPTQAAELYKDLAGSYNLDAIDLDGVQVTGPWGTLVPRFDGGHSGNSTASGLVNVPIDHDFTVSFWSKAASLGTGSDAVYWSGTDDLIIYPADSNGPVDPSVRVFWRDHGGNMYAEGGALDVWQHVSVTSRANDDHEARVNYDDAVGTSSSSGTTGPFDTFYLARLWDGNSLAGVRIYNGARSPEWLETEYANQSDPSTFAIPGTPEDVGGGGAVSGTGAATLSALTASASGTVTAPAITGTVAAALSALTADAAGAFTSAEFTGTGAATLSAMTATASGVLIYTGTGSGDLAALTASASGAFSAADFQGTGQATLSALTASASGILSYSGTASATLAALTGGALGSIPVTGTASATLAAMTGTATGTFSRLAFALAENVLYLSPDDRTLILHADSRTIH